ncbi:unnamed protein product [Rhizophagus irregularis]|uniref:Uncharacterized protein n=1 Tax=Rhizophagus irregularis TaxID=588596 RepID=A0A2N1MLU7_9GLOM|nr:hypothetical protein RhiirC2_790125 [Rhizophagus irregularis]CAB4390426.1 unnamed protein product [Rhizophagus irregularis]CAB5370574.1 unnamed protein product [Rhizophagus irregularis]
MCFPSVFRTSETDWEYFTVGQYMLSIIDLLKKRGQKVDYDLWAAQGPEYKIWDYNHCLEAFKAVENIAHESSDEEFKIIMGSMMEKRFSLADGYPRLISLRNHSPCGLA